MPTTPPCPPRRIPPKLRQINDRRVQVIPAIITDFGARSVNAIAYYDIATGAVVAISEVAKRELYRELLAEAKRSGTHAGEAAAAFLEHQQDLYNHHLENSE